MHLLLCTLGNSWQVVPEVYAFLAPRILDLYANHPQRDAIERLRASLALPEPDELWVATTDAATTREGLDRLDDWRARLPGAPPLRAWIAAGTGDLEIDGQCRIMRELLLRLVLHAAERMETRSLVVSLAGGRKTMSADIQHAGLLFGCTAMVHVVGVEPLPELLKIAGPDDLVRPLRRDIVASTRDGRSHGAIMPVVVVREAQRADVVDVAWQGKPPVSTRRFALPIPSAGARIEWRPQDDSSSLADEIDGRTREGIRLLGDFLGRVDDGEPLANWRSLYRLPPRRIDELKNTIVDDRHAEWLKALPKADLHCHLGGCLDIPAQRQVGRAVWDALDRGERDAAQQAVRRLVAAKDWAFDLRDQLAQGATSPSVSAARAAALLVVLDDVALERRLFPDTPPRVALKDRPQGFRLYETPGDLVGSTILGHPAAVAEYARQLLAAARRDGVRYLEVRGSPHKYLGGDALGFLRAFRTGLADACSPGTDTPGVRFIVCIDRRLRDATIERAVESALQARDDLGGFVVGIDVAGDEQAGDLERLARLFRPALERCIHVTIHAGEGEPADKIWQAVYLLGAERIGHGLTLPDAGVGLRQRFRDRRICIEVCPTSNIEVVGYHDPLRADTAGRPSHPLGRLLDEGFQVAVCTDNPGISRTSATGELLAAARLHGRLSQWTMLALARSGFGHAFLPETERRQLLEAVDRAVYDHVTSPGQ